MGRKQIRTGKHLLFSFAGLIFLFLAGCALLEKIQEPAPPAISPAEREKILQREATAVEEKNKEERASAHLHKGRRLFVQGDFEGAFSENQMIVTFFPGKSPMEEALFMLGLIYVHPDNPNKNFGKALDFMKKVVKEHPNSIFVQQAKAWIGLLLMNEKAGKEDEKLTKENEKLIKENEKLIKEHEKMSKMLEEYKQVDIEIEGKKREKGR
jgi:outer membrane protein assembly factor BamD (BamD/ComL family)